MRFPYQLGPKLTTVIEHGLSDDCIGEQLIVHYFICALKQPAAKLPTLQLADELVYLLSYSLLTRQGEGGKVC